MWSRQVDDYRQFLCPSLVYHQEMDLCRSPKEYCFTFDPRQWCQNMLVVKDAPDWKGACLRHLESERLIVHYKKFEF